MSFLFPAFLIALASVTIPVLIHLFYFRRYRTIYFTNVRFLKESKEQKSTRSRLKRLLILASRILVLAFIVFGFSHPYFNKDGKKELKKNQVVSVYVDNSLSMTSLDEEGSLLSKAKNIAKSLMNNYENTNKFQLITNDFEGKHQNIVGKEQFSVWLDQVAISSRTKTLEEIIARQKQAAKGKDGKSVLYVISDFQKSTSQIDELSQDTAIDLYLIPLKNNQSRNVYIDSCWFDAPILKKDEILSLVIRIKKTFQGSENPLQVTLRINDRLKAVAKANMDVNHEILDTLSFKVDEIGWHSASVSINDYPVVFDDSYFFSFRIFPKVSVLSINSGEENQYLKAIFNKENFEFSNTKISAIDYKSMQRYDLIILNGMKIISSGMTAELKKYLKQGGDIFIIPDYDLDKISYSNSLLSLGLRTSITVEENQSKVVSINTNSDIFQDVFDQIPKNIELPTVNKRIIFSSYTSSDEEKLLLFSNHSSLVSKYKVSNGKIYLCGAYLDMKFTNLPAHAIFAPMMFKIALLSKDNRSYNHVVGRNEVLKVKIGRIQEPEKILKLVNDNIDIIPEQRFLGDQIALLVGNQVKEAGIYKVIGNQSGKIISLESFNYDRTESELETYKQKEIENLAEKYGFNTIEVEEGSLMNYVAGLPSNKTLWKVCLIFALLFLVSEMILIKYWR